MALSEAEELELLELEEAEAQAGSATKSVAPPQRTDLQAATNVIQSIRHGQPQEGGGMQVLKDAGQVTTMPFRGVRALAIGAGRALAGEGAAKSLNRASEAVSPDFVPETPAEKVADYSSKLMEVAAPIGQAGRVTKLGRAATELGTLKGAKAAVEGLKSKAGIDTMKAIEPVSKKAATDLVNTITKARKAKILDKVSLQNLHEDEVQLRNLLDAERVGKFARFMGKKPAGKLTDQGVALAAKNKEAVIEAQNNLIKGLKEARRRVGDIHLRNKIRNIIVGSLGAAAAKAALGNKASGPATSIVSEVSQ